MPHLELSELLAFENEGEVLSFRSPESGLLLWPLIRSALMEKALQEANGVSSFTPPTPSLWKRAVVRLEQFVARHDIPPSQFPILAEGQSDLVFFSTGQGVIKTEDGYSDRLVDFFAEVFTSKTMIVESSSHRDHLRPRAFAHVYSKEIIERKALEALAYQRPSPGTETVVEGLVSYLSEKFPYRFNDSSYLDKLRLHLIRRELEFRILKKPYSEFFRERQPKILFIEDASYGGLCHLLWWAKEAGIVTAEYQHGILTPNMPAYNLSDKAVNDPQMRRYYPDYLLTFGEFWERATNTVATCVPIGNPFFTEKTRSIDPEKFEGRPERLLFISSGIFPEQEIEWVCQAKSRLSAAQIEVQFRAHPRERTFAETRYKQLLKRGVTLDNAPLYTALEKATYVAGLASTVMVEALSLGKVVFQMEAPYANLHLIEGILKANDGNDLAEQIEKRRSQKIAPAQSQSKAWFDPDWKKNYMAFVRAEAWPERRRASRI